MEKIIKEDFMEGLTINVSDKGDIKVISCKGFIDTTTSQSLENTLSEILKKQFYKIIIDLSDVDYISSAGWGIFFTYMFFIFFIKNN